MTTLREEVELCMRRLSGGPVPNDSPYDRNYVAREYRDAMREDTKLEIWRRKQQGDAGDDKTHIGQFVASYKVSLAIDEMTSRIFVNIPDNFLSLKYNRGIYDVLIIDPKAKHLMNSILMCDNPNVMSHLPAGDPDLSPEVYFAYLEGPRIFFTRDIKRDKITDVILKLIVPGADIYDWDDALPVLPENVARIRDIVCERMMKPGRPQDRIADNNPNLRATNEAQR